MTSDVCVLGKDYVEYFVRLFSKLYEDLFEAYSRTPNFITSKPYVERALRLAQSGLSAAKSLLEDCKRQESLEGSDPNFTPHNSV